jgi:hypothetical protein
VVLSRASSLRAQDAEQTLWVLYRTDTEPIRVVLVAFPDAVEVDVYCRARLRRRRRFLRPHGAIQHAERLRQKLERRGYVPSRRDRRRDMWVNP